MSQPTYHIERLYDDGRESFTDMHNLRSWDEASAVHVYETGLELMADLPAIKEQLLIKRHNGRDNILREWARDSRPNTH